MQKLYTPRRAAVGAGKVVRPVGPGATRAQAAHQRRKQQD